MNTAKIVIGANFGDEGKGLMTDYFSGRAKRKGESCLVVCHNGGCQKGHTVVSPYGFRHVYHHFGSGTMNGADTYLAGTFIVNPTIFNKEMSELKRKGIDTKVFINKNAIVTTPFDMMINQIVEENRGASKHGSCGLGIYETIFRNYNFGLKITLSDFAGFSEGYLKRLLKNIAKEYVTERLKTLGVKSVSIEWLRVMSCIDNVVENYIMDFNNMMRYVELVTDDILNDYDYVVFEGSQGLLLDQGNTEYMPHLTPSNTGIKNPMKIIGEKKVNVEVCYVTRTYMTRHGAGRFDSECKKEDINSKIVDLTNIPNPYQDSIRYGHLDLHDLKNRIEKDLDGLIVKKSLAVTHCNEYRVDNEILRELFNGYNLYLSDGMTRQDVRLKNKIKL